MGEGISKFMPFRGERQGPVSTGRRVRRLGLALAGAEAVRLLAGGHPTPASVDVTPKLVDYSASSSAFSSTPDVFSGELVVKGKTVAEGAVSDNNSPLEKAGLSWLAGLGLNAASQELKKPGLPGEVGFVDVNGDVVVNTGETKLGVSLQESVGLGNDSHADVRVTEGLRVTNNDDVTANVKLEFYTDEHGGIATRPSVSDLDMSPDVLMSDAKSLFRPTPPGQVGMAPIAWHLNQGGTDALGKTDIIASIPGYGVVAEPVTIDVAKDGQVVWEINRAGSVDGIKHDAKELANALISDINAARASQDVQTVQLTGQNKSPIAA